MLQATNKDLFEVAKVQVEECSDQLTEEQKSIKINSLYESLFEKINCKGSAWVDEDEVKSFIDSFFAEKESLGWLNNKW